jgi:hypothetical protein
MGHGTYRDRLLYRVDPREEGEGEGELTIDTLEKEDVIDILRRTRGEYGAARPLQRVDRKGRINVKEGKEGEGKVFSNLTR